MQLKAERMRPLLTHLHTHLSCCTAAGPQACEPLTPHGETSDRLLCRAGPAEPQPPGSYTEALLAFKDSIPGFDSIVRAPTGQWRADGLPPCSWNFVSCDESQGGAMSLNFGGVQLQGGPAMSHQPHQILCVRVHGGCMLHDQWCSLPCRCWPLPCSHAAAMAHCCRLAPSGDRTIDVLETLWQRVPKTH